MVLNLNELESPSPKDALCQVWLILTNFVLSLFGNNIPFKKSGALHLKELESSSPKDALCQVWLKLAQWLWRRRFLNFTIS